MTNRSALEAADGGKPLQWARADLQSSLAAMRYYAGAADKIHGQSIEIDDSSRQVFTRREPMFVDVRRLCLAWRQH